MPTHFTPDTFKFLRGLARHNDREWFNERKNIYEAELKAPMLALVDEITTAMQTFAPEHMRPANKVMMRIYRDIRFSKNKQPYKTHLSAWWARRGAEKTSGSGFYLQISPAEVMVAAGVYMPQRDQLLRLRRWMSTNHADYRALVKKLLQHKSAGFVAIDPQALSRMPKGFAADDPAAELLRAHNWGLRAMLPAELALGPSPGKEIVQRFKLATPLVDALHSGMAVTATEQRRRLF